MQVNASKVKLSVLFLFSLIWCSLEATVDTMKRKKDEKPHTTKQIVNVVDKKKEIDEFKLDSEHLNETTIQYFQTHINVVFVQNLR